MNDKYNSGIDEFKEIFGDSITTSDIVSAALLGQISAEIVARRIEMNMTQKEFAKYLGVTQGMVSKWESSDYNFSIKTLADLATKLNMILKVELSNSESIESPQENTCQS